MILWAVRWYLRLPISYRDLEPMQRNRYEPPAPEVNLLVAGFASHSGRGSKAGHALTSTSNPDHPMGASHVTPVALTAASAATGRPCAVGMSTCRGLATISSAACRFP